MARRRMMSERMLSIAPFVVTLASAGMVALLMPNGFMRAVVMIGAMILIPVLYVQRRQKAASDRASRRRR